MSTCEKIKQMHLPIVQAMNVGIDSQFRLYSNYSYHRNWTIPYFINLIHDTCRANFDVSCPTSLIGNGIWCLPVRKI